MLMLTDLKISEPFRETFVDPNLAGVGLGKSEIFGYKHEEDFQAKYLAGVFFFYLKKS